MPTDHFHTLNRDIRARKLTDDFRHPRLQSISQPHIDSFNALFAPTVNRLPDDPNPLPMPSDVSTVGNTIGNGGILDLAVNDILERVVFDHVESEESRLGNRLGCKCD